MVEKEEEDFSVISHYENCSLHLTHPNNEKQ